MIHSTNCFEGNWNTYNFYPQGGNPNNQTIYQYGDPRFCSYLNTITPDKDLVSNYQLTYQQNKQQLQAIKTWYCSKRVDTLVWEIQFTNNLSGTVEISPNSPIHLPFIIIEKTKLNVVNIIYKEVYFNLDFYPINYPNYQYFPKNNLQVNAEKEDNAGNMFAQYQIGFVKQ